MNMTIMRFDFLSDEFCFRTFKENYWKQPSRDALPKCSSNPMWDFDNFEKLFFKGHP